MSRIGIVTEKEICWKHHTIVTLCRNIRSTLRVVRKKLKVENNTLRIDVRHVITLLDEIEQHATAAWGDGVRMEERLQKYRDAIEALGYVRSKK